MPVSGASGLQHVCFVERPLRAECVNGIARDTKGGKLTVAEQHRHRSKLIHHSGHCSAGGLAKPVRRPVVAWRRSPQAYASSGAFLHRPDDSNAIAPGGPLLRGQANAIYHFPLCAWQFGDFESGFLPMLQDWGMTKQGGLLRYQLHCKKAAIYWQHSPGYVGGGRRD